MQKLDFEVIAVSRGVNGILLISLKPIGTEAVSYQAGQFITLVFYVNGREIRRSYSLYSSPVADKTLDIAVKLVENGEISRWLHHQVSVGDTLRGLWPNGQFTYQASAMPRVVFLFAAGVGITPLFSILKSALLSEPQSKIVLIYSNRAQAQTLFFDELETWKSQYPDRLKIIYLWSNSKNLLRARLNSFLIGDLVQQELVYGKEQAVFYLCGPVDYMDICRFTLLGRGFKPEQIKKETFVLPEDEQDEDDTTEKKIDTNTYSVNIDFFGRRYTFDVPPDKRILEVALAQNLNLPYSCAGGVCSTCIAKCTSGGVRMDYNEVLTDEEIAAGQVLVCTGHPTENGTTIVWS